MSLNLDMANKVWLSALPKGCNKLVLLCFCKHLNDTSTLSFPGIPRVAKMCSMSERTVQCHVRALQAAGILRAKLRTGRTTRYAIDLSSLTALVFESDTVVLDACDSVDNFEIPAGIVDNSPPTPATFAENAQVFAPQPAENDIKPVEICTLTSYVTPTNSERTAAPAWPMANAVVEDVNPKILADFVAIRKAKTRDGYFGEIAVQYLRVQATRAGLTLEQALTICCERKWARFEAVWLEQSDQAEKRFAGGRSNTATATTPTPAGALYTPPVSTPAAPEIRAAEQQRQRQMLQTRPEPVVGIQLGGTGPGWAHLIVSKHRAGQPVRKSSLLEACTALRITPASLSSASLH